MEEFVEHVPNVPNALDFTVGYFDGTQQAKIWLFTSHDLQTMYKKYMTGRMSHCGVMEDHLLKVIVRVHKSENEIAIHLQLVRVVGRKGRNLSQSSKSCARSMDVNLTLRYLDFGQG